MATPIYLSIGDEIHDLQEVLIVISHNRIHHYSPTTIISKRKFKKYHVSKFFEHCQGALQVTASLEDFLDLSDAEESTNQFDVVRHELDRYLLGM